MLAEQPAWTPEHIEATMQGDTTAMVMPGEPGVRFAEDIYRHDARLQRALAGRRTPAPPR